MEDIELVAVDSPEEAIRELTHSPAQALVINSPIERSMDASWLNSLPYETPAIICWVPGLQEAASELGVVKYLLKPVTAEILISSLESLGSKAKTILVVEDEPDLMRLYIRILSAVNKPKYRLLRAGSGQQALDIMRDFHPDAVLLDLNLPDKDGLQVLQEKNADLAIREIPVIVISARDPANEAVVANQILVTRTNRFTTQDLMDFTQLVSERLTPRVKPNGSRPPGELLA
jgi:CheY-like chemotaxis protein